MVNRSVDTSEMSLAELEDLRRVEYSAYEPLACPALENELVYFTSAGFHHSIHKGTGATRNESDQRMRLNLLPRIRTVIRRAELKEVREQRIKVKDKVKGAQFYKLLLETNGHKKVVVILRRIGDGKLQYHSVFYQK